MYVQTRYTCNFNHEKLMLWLPPFILTKPPMDLTKPRAARACWQRKGLPHPGEGGNDVPPRPVSSCEGRVGRAVRYFLWLPRLNEVNTVVEVKSSSDMEKEATGAAAGGGWEEQWELAGWRVSILEPQTLVPPVSGGYRP